MNRTRNYKSYQDYINFQLEKTNNKNKQKKWLGDEWRLKIDIFKNLFINNLQLIKDKNKCICLGSRTGQEVVALQELGIQDTIGIDLHEFKPYTIKGDIHNIDFPNEHFDLAFSNILDHSILPNKFIEETYRILKPGGIFILHLQIDISQDKYTEVIITNKNEFQKMFNKFKILQNNKIDSDIIAMNYEYIFMKI